MMFLYLLFEEYGSFVAQERDLFGLQLDGLVIVSVSFLEFLLFVRGVPELLFSHRLRVDI